MGSEVANTIKERRDIETYAEYVMRGEDWMKRIAKVAIVGMGALGLLYGEHIQNAAGKEAVCFLLDEERIQRYQTAVFTINDKKMDFSMKAGKGAGKVDLVIVATKYSGLRSAMEVMEDAVGEDTIIISVLNGIVSEKILAEKFNKNNIVPCVALGMDAMRDGYALNYCNKGSLRIGIIEEAQRPALDALKSYFNEIRMPYGEETDIMHAMWGKIFVECRDKSDLYGI